MRKLTLQRKKSFIACLCSIYVYISCEKEKAERTLGNIPCKLMGKLKNGKSIVLDISEEPTHVFVAYSRNFPEKYHTSFYLLPGKEDVSLFTEPEFNPANGNPFTIFEKQN